MRSRYSANVTQNEAHLLRTWHPTTRPPSFDFIPQQRWLGLKILRTEAGTDADCQGAVEFVARYKIDGKGHRLHEASRFIRDQGIWLYVDGQRGPTDSSNRE